MKKRRLCAVFCVLALLPLHSIFAQWGSPIQTAALTKALDQGIGLSFSTDISLGNILDKNYALFTTGTALKHKTGQASMVIPNLNWVIVKDNWIFQLDYSMILDDNGNADAGYYVPSWHPSDYSIELDYTFNNSGWYLLGWFGSAQSRSQFVGYYGWNQPGFSFGGGFKNHHVGAQLGLIFVNLEPRYVEFWVRPRFNLFLDNFTLSAILSMMVFNIVPGTGGSKWGKVGVSLNEAGAIFNDLEFDLQYAWNSSISGFLGMTISFPLNKNALGTRANEKVYGDHYGIILGPYVSFAPIRDLDISIGFYLYNIANSLDAFLGTEYARAALRPFVGLKWTM
ncbi:MAG: hypothetical protein LBM77_07215 [Spirochaetaceae bacterium]|jgi:hypothetical protein|nr:hypothetical protein [Spirochaetaceae bacterium]